MNSNNETKSQMIDVLLMYFEASCCVTSEMVDAFLEFDLPFCTERARPNRWDPANACVQDTCKTQYSPGRPPLALQVHFAPSTNQRATCRTSLPRHHRPVLT